MITAVFTDELLNMLSWLRINTPIKKHDWGIGLFQRSKVQFLRWFIDSKEEHKEGDKKAEFSLLEIQI